MNHFLQRLPLRTKILLGDLILLVTFLCPTILLYVQTIEKTIEINIVTLNQINSQLNLNLDLIFSPLDRINYLHYTDGQMRQILVSQGKTKSGAEAFEDDLYLRNALNHAFRANPFILRGAIINKYGDVYSSLTSNTMEFDSYIGQLLEGVKWENRNEAYFTDIHEVLIQRTQHRVITVLQQLYYYDNYVGVLGIDLNYDGIVQCLNEAYSVDFSSSLCVISGNELIYNSPAAYLDNTVLGEEKNFTRLRETAEDLIAGETSQQVELSGKPYLITAVKNQKSGWILLQYIPMEEMNRIGFKGISNMLIVFAVVVVAAIPLSLFLSKQTIKPLARLLSNMEITETGHLKLMEMTKETAGVETGLLIQNYNVMAERINEDIDATYLYELNNKRMQLKMLRYQINPHFMYNTLNTISALAEIEGVQSIVQMAGSLSKILYYNVKGRDVVQLQEEIEYVQNYLQIQDIRFPGRYHTVIEIEPGIEKSHMLKFLVQPILENSISHGLSDKRSDARIALRVRREGEDLVLTVFDNGVGLDEDACERWNRRFQENPPGGFSEENDEDGIGLLNVNSRIKNFYGAEYGVTISSKKGEYTEVTLRLKVLEKALDRPEQ